MMFGEAAGREFCLSLEQLLKVPQQYRTIEGDGREATMWNEFH